MSGCPNRIDADDPASAPCGDEGRMCDACFAAEAASWASYFGLRPGMTPEQRRSQLEAFRPLRLMTRELQGLIRESL